ncbi:hypothetical protein BDZ88DRAFT_422465 [Geranomyces variabilis]|nr:hypothetical protein BDZ88DRAFT_422465 [Geranomyces variabilis]KAJ3137571.1 Microsomal glutathione S-transferase 3 [Geranomyces variabilis]
MTYALGLQLTQEHGYALAVAASSALLLQYLAAKAGSLRKKADVPYPYMYAERSVAEKNPIANKHNCYQRAHQNTLEAYPVFLVLFTITAIKYPLIASGAGATWIAGRIAYAQGYYTGNPAQRQRGVFGYLGLLTLLGASVKTCFDLIMY